MEVGLRSKNSINQTPGGQVRCRMDIYRYTAPIGGDTNRHKDKKFQLAIVAIFNHDHYHHHHEGQLVSI